jgi:hypothetical protein
MIELDTAVTSLYGNSGIQPWHSVLQQPFRGLHDRTRQFDGGDFALSDAGYTAHLGGYRVKICNTMWGDWKWVRDHAAFSLESVTR